MKFVSNVSSSENKWNPMLTRWRPLTIYCLSWQTTVVTELMWMNCPSTSGQLWLLPEEPTFYHQGMGQEVSIDWNLLKWLGILKSSQIRINVTLISLWICFIKTATVWRYLKNKYDTKTSKMHFALKENIVVLSKMKNTIWAISFCLTNVLNYQLVHLIKTLCIRSTYFIITI